MATTKVVREACGRQRAAAAMYSRGGERYMAGGERYMVLSSFLTKRERERLYSLEPEVVGMNGRMRAVEAYGEVKNAA